jgi:5'-3' exonuclease
VVHLIDASGFVFRAWFALPESLRAPDGRPVNAVHGFVAFLAGFLAEVRPRHLAACFDESLSSSFRNARYPDYKANRAAAPDDLKEQFRLCRRACRVLGVAELASKRYEADDLIATLAAKARRAGRPVTIVSRDKDLAQLLGPRDVLWDYVDEARYDARAIARRFGVPPARLPDWQGLVGDAVDNIPGVRGIGPQAARALLARFGTLEGIYADLEAVAELEVRGAARLAELLAAQRRMAFLSRELATLHARVPLRHALADLRWRGVDRRACARFATELGFGARSRARFAALPARPR